MEESLKTGKVNGKYDCKKVKRRKCYVQIIGKQSDYEMCMVEN